MTSTRPTGRHAANNVNHWYVEVAEASYTCVAADSLANGYVNVLCDTDNDYQVNLGNVDCSGEDDLCKATTCAALEDLFCEDIVDIYLKDGSYQDTCAANDNGKCVTVVPAAAYVRPAAGSTPKGDALTWVVTSPFFGSGISIDCTDATDNFGGYYNAVCSFNGEVVTESKVTCAAKAVSAGAATTTANCMVDNCEDMAPEMCKEGVDIYRVNYFTPTDIDYIMTCNPDNRDSPTKCIVSSSATGKLAAATTMIAAMVFAML